MGDDLKAVNLGEVVLHLNYLKDAILDLSRQVKDQSTTMATKGELEALRVEVHAAIVEMRAEIASKSVSSWASSFSSMLIRVAAVITALTVMAAFLVGMVRYFDKTYVIVAPAASAPVR